MQESKKTHFGYKTVEEEQKVNEVAKVFHSVANKYDVMNDLMSLGVHRLWKRFAVSVSGIVSGHRVLDLAGGTGDLAALLAPKVGPQGKIIVSDINASMLNVGRDRLLDRGYCQIDYVQADAEQLPFVDDYFDHVVMAFGLRNVTRKEKALESIYRVLKPGGKLWVLEFSKVKLPVLKQLYDIYSFNVLPFVGQAVAGDADSYRYLAESIRMHPDQESLKEMMQQAGFTAVDYYNLSAGIVALHHGLKV